MKTEEFVNKVLKSVVDENVAHYRSIFSSSLPEKTTDEYWKNALQLFHSLFSKDQQTLLNIMRQVSVDTVSNLFGILDGSSALGSKIEEFELIHKPSSSKINGDLQDIFLSKEN